MSVWTRFRDVPLRELPLPRTAGRVAALVAQVIGQLGLERGLQQLLGQLLQQPTFAEQLPVPRAIQQLLDQLRWDQITVVGVRLRHRYQGR
jgi:hypothetical protein